MRKIIILGILVCVIRGSSIAQERGAFIILKKPQVYSLFNRYEQPLSNDEKRLFVFNTPLRIVHKKTLLGDGISPALQGALMDKSFFLLLDEKGRLVGDEKRTYCRQFSNCRIIRDTMQVVKKNAVRLYTRYPSQGKMLSIQKGESVVPIFKYKNSYFVYYYKKGKIIYGWYTPTQRAAWKTVTSIEQEDYTLSEELLQKIRRQIEETNKLYDQYFSHFTGTTGLQKSVPQWQVSVLDNSLRCSLSKPYNSSGQLESSSQYLVQSLENIVLGKPFSVSNRGGVILIEPKRSNR